MYIAESILKYKLRLGSTQYWDNCKITVCRGTYDGCPIIPISALNEHCNKEDQYDKSTYFVIFLSKPRSITEEELDETHRYFFIHRNIGHFMCTSKDR